jgi:hypothetical protein
LARTGQKLTNRSIEYVEWIDAVASVGWDSGSGGNRPAHIVTVGKLVHEDKDCLVVAGTFSYTDDETNARMAIPKGWVKNRKTIKL